MIFKCFSLLIICILIECPPAYRGFYMIEATDLFGDEAGLAANTGTLGFTFRDSPSSANSSVLLSRINENLNIEPKSDNVRRILLKDLISAEVDADGNAIRQQMNNEQKKREMIEQMLAELSNVATRSIRIRGNEVTLPAAQQQYVSRSSPPSNSWGEDLRQVRSRTSTHLNEESSPSSPDLSAYSDHATSANGVASSDLERWHPNLVTASDKLYPAKSRKSATSRFRPTGSGQGSIGPGAAASIVPTPFYLDLLPSRKALGHPLSPSFPLARKALNNSMQQTRARSSGGGGGTLSDPLMASPSASMSQSASSSLSPSHHHRMGTEEIALHTPVHSHSFNDIEWKRVENSRWNNLRGMWGKRAISDSDGDSLDDRFKENEARKFPQPQMALASESSATADSGEPAEANDEA